MECINRELQQRVWQRVQNAASTAEAAHRPTPEGLLLDERTDAAQFRVLGYKTLAAQSAERAAILQGICRLSGIPDAELMPDASRDSSDAIIRQRLMGRLLRRYQTYLEMQDAYAPIYAALAELTRTSLVLLAKHVGTSPLHNGRK